MQPRRSQSQLARQAVRPSPRLEVCKDSERPNMQIRAHGGVARSAAPPATASGERGSVFLQIPSRNEA
eukprot:15296357-Alexandrium_andersonii.AAC.1